MQKNHTPLLWKHLAKKLTYLFYDSKVMYTFSCNFNLRVKIKNCRVKKPYLEAALNTDLILLYLNMIDKKGIDHKFNSYVVQVVWIGVQPRYSHEVTIQSTQPASHIGRAPLPSKDYLFTCTHSHKIHCVNLVSGLY